MTVAGKARGPSALSDLALKDLPEEGLSLDEVVPEAWLTERLAGGHGLSWTAVGDGAVTLRVDPLGGVDERPPVRVHGRIRAQVRTDCVRCLEAVDDDLNSELDTTLFAAGADSDDDASPDFQDARYDGETIPIPELMREALLLDLDMNPTCADREACDARTAGLIAAANAPAAAADAEAEGAIDPRWAPLARLKGSDPD